MTTLCVIYVSEGVKQNIIKLLTQKASLGGPLVHSFVDATYGRTSFYLMGKCILRTSSRISCSYFIIFHYPLM